MTEEAKPLYWDASYEIVLALLQHYPETEPTTLGLQELKRLIVSLPNFIDDPALAHDDLLIEILREYYEEATHADDQR